MTHAAGNGTHPNSINQRLCFFVITSYSIHYTKLYDPIDIELGSLVIVGVVLDRSTPESFAEFETSIVKLKMIIDCQLVAGEFDYFLKVRVKDMANFNQLYANHLLALPGVRQIRTFFVMKEVIENAPLAF